MWSNCSRGISMTTWAIAVTKNVVMPKVSSATLSA